MREGRLVTQKVFRAAAAPSGVSETGEQPVPLHPSRGLSEGGPVSVHNPVRLRTGGAAAVLRPDVVTGQDKREREGIWGPGNCGEHCSERPLAHLRVT